MSYTNGTTHYNLPLTTNNDKRDWSDTNQAFTDVDAALYGAVQGEAQAELDIDALETRMDTAEGNIATNTGDISALDTRLTTAEGTIVSQGNAITDVRSDSEDMICAYNEATATSTHAYSVDDYFIYNDVLYRATAPISIGDTIVPDTNCATTNITTEILSIPVDKLVSTLHGTGTNTYADLCAFLHDNYDSGHKYHMIYHNRASDTYRVYNLLTFGASISFSCVIPSSTNTIIDTIGYFSGNVAHRYTLSGSTVTYQSLLTETLTANEDFMLYIVE